MIQFNEATHTYTKNGVILPSVTEITRFLAYDYKTDRPWLAEEAARRGTAVHEACMLMDYGEEPEELPEIAGYLTAYRRFLADYRPDWTLIEHPMGSVGMGYAGYAGPVRGDAGESSIAGHQERLHAASSGGGGAACRVLVVAVERRICSRPNDGASAGQVRRV